MKNYKLILLLSMTILVSCKNVLFLTTIYQNMIVKS
jgi:hypothetical protein